MSEDGFCNVRVLHIQSEANIGDGVMRQVLENAIKEYLAGDTGHKQDETFICSDGTKVTVGHFYRNTISK